MPMRCRMLVCGMFLVVGGDGAGWFKHPWEMENKDGDPRYSKCSVERGEVKNS